MPMQRARRLASVAVVASLAVAGLSACRSEPSVAAYVGETKFTESRVEQVWDEAHEKFSAAAPVAGQSAAPAQLPITRSDVVRTLVSADVLAQVAKQRNVTLPADLTLAEYASSLRLPQDTEFVRLFAETDAYVRVLRESVKDAPEPSDADLRDVYDVLVASQQVNASGTFEEFKAALPAQNKELVQTAAAVRKQIAEVTGSLDIRVNPKYQPIGIPVLQFQTGEGEVRPLLSVPLGADDTAPVTDAR